MCVESQAVEVKELSVCKIRTSTHGSAHCTLACNSSVWGVVVSVRSLLRSVTRLNLQPFEGWEMDICLRL
jgi:hypothetical protein